MWNLKLPPETGHSSLLSPAIVEMQWWWYTEMHVKSHVVITNERKTYFSTPLHQCNMECIPNFYINKKRNEKILHSRVQNTCLHDDATQCVDDHFFCSTSGFWPFHQKCASNGWLIFNLRTGTNYTRLLKQMHQAPMKLDPSLLWINASIVQAKTLH